MFTSSTFNMMYAFTFLPILLLDIPIGIVIDRVDLKKSVFVLLVITLLSQTVTGLMFHLRPRGYRWVVYLMRSVFGTVGEGTFVAQAAIIGKYGINNYETIMGLCLSAPFLFDSLSSFISTQVYDATKSVPLVNYIGSSFALLSLGSLFVLNQYFFNSSSKV